MTLAALVKAIRERPGLEPFYLPAAEFFAVQREMGDFRDHRGEPFLCAQSGYLNFLCCGVEIRPES